MYIIENFIARQPMRADGQTALFVSKTNAFEFFESNLHSRFHDERKKVVKFSREDSNDRKSAYFTYDNGENEIICVSKIKFFDE